MRTDRRIGWVWTLWLALWLAMWAASGAAHAQAGSVSAPYTGIAGTTVRFATVAEGRAVLGADDEWAAATSEFQRAAIVGGTNPVSRAQLLAFTRDTVQPWTPPHEARWRKALDAIAPKLAALKLPLPSEVLLVNTDGRDAANAPYTRSHAVVLPMSALREGAANTPPDDVLMAHELFHVASRHAPALASRLYTTIGFEPVALLQWPLSWVPARIVNPDAPQDRHAMPVTIAGRAAMVMPLILASRTELKPGESFFSVLELRLLEVTASASGPTAPVLRDGQPVWHAPAAVPDFLARLGGNTGYIIHPEEAMADNFALLASGRPARNPQLLQRIEAVLLAPR